MLKNVMSINVESAKEAVQEVIVRAVDSKAVAASVVAGTAALGLSEMQSLAQLFAAIAAGILSIVLAVKHGYDVYRVYKNGDKDDQQP